MAGPSDLALAWAAAGAMALTGHDDQMPLVAPDGIVARIRALGAPLDIDPLPLLGERAAALRLTRLGSTSCGHAARILPAADGHVAVNLPRDDDVEAIPAWLEAGEPGSHPWELVSREVATRTTADLVERAALLGLPVGSLGEVAPPPRPVRAEQVGEAAALEKPPLVVDLSSLWAGPLCTRLLVDRGARVFKVESAGRPDAARGGPRAFFDRLHVDKESVVLDLTTDAGRAALAALIARADVVVEASRRRALEQLGIIAAEVLAADDGPRVWVSVTGHGRELERVAFGDDAAVAGGLVADDGDGPCFVADAIADPLAGVAAATATVEALESGGRWLLDVSLAGVAAHVAGDDRGRPWAPDHRLIPRPPTIDPSPRRASPLGAHTAAVATEFGLAQ